MQETWETRRYMEDTGDVGDMRSSGDLSNTASMGDAGDIGDAYSIVVFTCSNSKTMVILNGDKPAHLLNITLDHLLANVVAIL